MARDFKLDRQIEAIRKRFREIYVEQEPKIRNIAGYTAVTLARSPKRVKSKTPQPGKKVNNKNFFSLENQIFIPRRGGVQPAGLTVSQWLKSAKAKRRKKGKPLPEVQITKSKSWHVAEPAKTSILRKGSEPGQAPKSWNLGRGRADYFISQKENGLDDAGKKKWVNNWQIEKAGEMRYFVRLKAFGSKRAPNVLHLLEKGGTVEGTSYLEGYVLETVSRKNGRKVVHLSKKMSRPKSVRIAPRPFVSPALERVREQVKKKKKW